MFLRRNPVISTVALIGVLILVGIIVDHSAPSDRVFWSGYLAMIFFYALFFFIALWYSGKKVQGHILANRSLPLWLGVFTMSATWVGGGFINGTAEYTFSEGLIWVQAPWGYAMSLIIGGIFFAGPMRKKKYTTMLDPLENKFGKETNILFFIPAFLGDLFWTSAIMVALGSTFGIILGMELSTSIILSGIVVIFYTSAGGLWSVAITDVVQLLILVIGLVLVEWSFSNSWSDLSDLIFRYRSKMGDRAAFIPGKGQLGVSRALWWDSAFLLMLGGIPWQVYFQRVLSSENSKVAVRLSIIAGVVCLLAAVPPVLIGMKASITDWVSLGFEPPTDPALVLPHVIKYLADPIVATIGLGAIAAAVMSSADSSILASSSLLVWNLYPKSQNMESASRQRLLRTVISVVGVLTIILALQVGSIYELWFLCSDLVYCLLFPALVTALFDPKANQYGAVAGFIVALVLRVGGGESLLGIPPILPYPLEEGVITIPFKSLSMVAGLLTIIVVSRVFPLASTRSQSR